MKLNSSESQTCFTETSLQFQDQVHLWFLNMLEAEINPPERNGQVQLDVARVRLAFSSILNLLDGFQDLS